MCDQSGDTPAGSGPPQPATPIRKGVPSTPEARIQFLIDSMNALASMHNEVSLKTIRSEDFFANTAELVKFIPRVTRAVQEDLEKAPDAAGQQPNLLDQLLRSAEAINLSPSVSGRRRARPADDIQANSPRDPPNNSRVRVNFDHDVKVDMTCTLAMPGKKALLSHSSFPDIEKEWYLLTWGRYFAIGSGGVVLMLDWMLKTFVVNSDAHKALSLPFIIRNTKVDSFTAFELLNAQGDVAGWRRTDLRQKYIDKTQQTLMDEKAQNRFAAQVVSYMEGRELWEVRNFDPEIHAANLTDAEANRILAILSKSSSDAGV